MNENRLSPLPQYHIDRDKLCEIVKETIGYDRTLWMRSVMEPLFVTSLLGFLTLMSITSYIWKAA